MSIFNYPSQNGVLTSLIWRKTATGGETSLSGYDNASQALSYTPGQEQVFLNGILLVRGEDYTATNGTSITGLTALAAGDFVQINCYNNFSVASIPAASITGTITNAQIDSLATSKLTGTISNSQLAGSISNDKLSNSSVTINGNSVSLGGSTTISTGGMTLLSTTSLSGSATITVSNINQNYRNLILFLKDFQPASAATLSVHFNGTAGLLSWIRMLQDAGSTSLGSGQSGAVPLGYSLHNGTGNYGDGAINHNVTLQIDDYSRVSSMKTFRLQGNGIVSPSTNWGASFISGGYHGLSQITSVTFTLGANFTAGTLYVYGVS